jgi:hypothetical protein
MASFQSNWGGNDFIFSRTALQTDDDTFQLDRTLLLPLLFPEAWRGCVDERIEVKLLLFEQRTTHPSQASGWVFHCDERRKAGPGHNAVFGHRRAMAILNREMGRPQTRQIEHVTPN